MNVLLENWDTPFGLPPFARIRDEDFGPAFDEALARARATISSIAEGPGTSFAEVIEALELAEGDLDRVAGVFYNLSGADSTEAREALMRELAPKMSAFSSEVTNNKALWAKIEALWQGREGLGLTAEQLRVLELYRQMFVRSGAALEGAKAERLTAVKARLAVLGTQFSQNLLADERSWFMELPEADLVRLPGFVQDAAKAAGAEKGTGPVVTLNRSLIVPFLQFSPNRALREKAYEAWV
ncbi:MAG TPA: peptidase M3, partial [Tabrizicola sp.]|nr:peptidase M3 [Tabrizicola sp.]